MSRYDELIDQNRKEKADQIAGNTQKELEADELKARYVAAFIRALPEFYQALVRNDVWKVYEHEQKSFLVRRKETIKCVHLRRWDSREGWYTTDSAVICADGRYLLLSGAGKLVKQRNGEYSTAVDGYEEVNIDRFAEHLYDALKPYKSRQFETFEQENCPKLHAALINDDADEVAFQYFAFCLPK
ncbi:MAG: hypothetical protein IJM79_05055 [Erysipelotrichaceae bacterium]|nr:hypothetical protein [Erysipelotrichaceae bacterium]